MKINKNSKAYIITKQLLDSNILANIVAILTLIVTILFGVLAYYFPNGSQDNNNSKNFGLNTSAIIVFATLIIATLINIIYTNYIRKKLKKYKVISILSKLQNKYILQPEFKTSKEHGENSKERDLRDQGNARILTNSLSYDIYYCKEIADNIIKGAKYTYVLPAEFQAVHDLQNYISALYNRLSEQISENSPEMDYNRTTNKVNDILKTKLEFWFFNEDVLCLYNYARFDQIGDPNFLQSWWYVNPTTNSESSYMLAHEFDMDDQESLNSVFDIIKSESKISNGKAIHDNRNRLEEIYLRRRG